MIRVDLEWYEIATLYDVTGRRAASSQRDGRRHRDASAHVGPAEQSFRSLNGTGGEMAAAKALDVYWSGTVDTFHAADLGADWQVRTRADVGADLCVRPDDNDADRYLLVVGTPPTYRVVGWVYGHEAKRSEWAGHSGGNLVYYVPRTRLRPITPS